MTKPEISVKQLRHKAEKPMLILCSILTVLFWIGLIIAMAYEITPPEWTYPVMFGLVAPLFGLYALRYYYWKTVSNGVQITERQFPEIYQMYLDIATDMGFGRGQGVMASVPRLYLVNGNGTMNAFASKCELKRGYVVLYSDILGLAYEKNDFDAVRFILAHELGHIKCGHVNLWRLIIRPVGEVLLIDPSLSRAQEWSADRCAYYYAPEGKRSMMALFAGKHLYQQVDFEEYCNCVEKHEDGFWLKATNFMAGHAIGFRRMQAIKETEEKGWNVHGKML